jgi:hypothetical protein
MTNSRNQTIAVAPKDFYVYLHRKATTGEVFYVGKGCGGRAWTRKNRNPFWHKVVAKHGIVVEIIVDGLQEWAALEFESGYIALYGRRNTGYGTLINLTDGGDNPPHTPESIAAGALKRKQNPEHQARLRLRLAEMHKSKEWLEQFKAMTQKRTASESWKINLKRALEKRTQDEKWRKSVKQARSIQAQNPEWIDAVRKACNKPVQCVETGTVFSSGAEAAKWIGADSSPKTVANGISRACRNHGATSYGYHWRFMSNPT